MRTTARYGRAFANWLEGKLDEVRAAREDPKLSDSKAAELIGVSHAMVSRFRAAASLPSRATTRALVIGLNAQRVPATVAEVEELVLASDPARAEIAAPPDFMQAPKDQQADAGVLATRDLIRETVHETLAQMGHPRVAQDALLAEGELYAAAFDAAIRALPEEYRARLPSLFRDELRRRRREIVAQQ